MSSFFLHRRCVMIVLAIWFQNILYFHFVNEILEEFVIYIQEHFLINKHLCFACISKVCKMIAKYWSLIFTR